MPGPPEVVWDLITDWDHVEDWMLEARDVTVTSDRREGVGVEAEATIRIAGVTTTDRIRVTAWEPPSRVAMEHLAWVKGTGEMNLTPMGDGETYLFWREEFEPPFGLVGTIGMTAFKPLMKQTFERDLRVLRALTRARTQAL